MINLGIKGKGGSICLQSGRIYGPRMEGWWIDHLENGRGTSDVIGIGWKDKKSCPLENGLRMD